MTEKPTLPERAKMKLRTVLELLDHTEVMPDKRQAKWEDIRSGSSYKIRLCFMCEEETWICTYPHHPILIPWYDCDVTSISPYDEDTLDIWLDYIPFWQKQIGFEAGEQK